MGHTVIIGVRINISLELCSLEAGYNYYNTVITGIRGKVSLEFGLKLELDRVMALTYTLMLLLSPLKEVFPFKYKSITHHLIHTISRKVQRCHREEVEG